MANLPWDGSGSVFGLVMRVARLGPSGLPLVGAGNTVTANAFTKLDFDPVYKDGVNIEEPNAAGGICITYDGDASLRHWNVKIEICSVAPELMEILSAGSVLSVATDVMGWASPDIGGSPSGANGVSVEVWSRAVLNAGAAATNPYIHWLAPRVKNLKLTSPLTIGAEAVKGTFEGIAIGNPLWGDGPLNDWPATIPSAQPLQYIRQSTTPPSSVAGYGTSLA